MNKKRKPHVLFIATFPPPIHGSAVVSKQIKESKLINNEFKGSYVNIGTSRKMDEIGKSGLKLYFTKMTRFIASFLRTFWLLLTHKYDLCYCAITINGIGFLKDVPYVLLCHLFRKRIVIHQHNKGMSRFINKPLYYLLYKLVYHNAKVILLSQYLYEDISVIVDKKNVMVCPNGIKPTINVPKDYKKSKANDLPHILYLSNLIKSKGCLVLLECCKILVDRGYNFSCDFVGGDTKEISEVCFKQEIVNKGLTKYVKYHGRKYGVDKDVYWSQANIFVFPTYYHNECFPLVLLEAMEKSVACISTTEGGIRDIITDNVSGYVVPKHDATALANTIEKLLNDPCLCNQMGREGYKIFNEKFTEDKFEKNMIRCLKKCLKS